MRKNSKNEKVIRAMAIGISAMLMASSPLTALAAEGEGTTFFRRQRGSEHYSCNTGSRCMLIRRTGGRKRCRQGCRGAPKRVPLM